MATEIAKYSESLRKLCKEYYSHIIEYEEYKQMRSKMLDEIEDSLCRPSVNEIDDKSNILSVVKTYAKKLNLIE